MSSKRIVLAIGGNAINRANQEGTVYDEFRNVREILGGIIGLIRQGYQLLITHGNGPQAGHSLIRVELGLTRHIPGRPLGVIVADTQGGLGYMIEQSLYNRLRLENINKQCVTILSQVLVDKNDPAFQNPSKPVGPFYTELEAKSLEKERGWQVAEDSGRGWRRVVASPIPQGFVEKDIIKSLVEQDIIVISGGGGGIPVYEESNGTLEGLDCVVDKDFSSAILANEIDAEILIIATGVEKVAINFGKENQQDLDRISIADAKRYIDENQFGKGSMLPKIKAAINFLENGGKKVIITLPETIHLAIEGKTGTTIEKS
ncbi:MAG: carbamate kinase [Calditrichaeota bacterium]|nr:carbamate kinase [Calditrichota bacterium]